jgi:hypothetical protein
MWPSTPAKAGELQAPVQLGLHNETLSQKEKKQKNKKKARDIVQ